MGVLIQEEDIKNLQEIFEIIEDLTYHESDNAKYEKLSQARFIARMFGIKYKVNVPWANVTIISAKPLDTIKT